MVWLKNHTSTKALEAATPLQALTGHNLDLLGLQEWGRKVLVHNTTNTKFGGCMKEGRWVGLDAKSKASCIYWPEKMATSVECNVRFDQDYVIVLLNQSSPDPTPSKPITESNHPCVATLPMADPQSLAHETPMVEGTGARVKWPSQYIQHICAGEGTATGDDRALPCGVQSATITETPERGDTPSNHALVTSIPTGTEPHNEWEARNSPEWPHWHEAMSGRSVSLHRSRHGQ